MMVLDCSAAVHIVRRTPEGESFAWLMSLDQERVLAPALFRVEAANAFWKYVQAGNLVPSDARRYVRAATALVDEFVPIESLCAEALVEGMRLSHSVYDMLYFVLARRSGATLVTADRRLNDLCEREGVACFHDMVRGKDGDWRLRSAG